jgi:hypothetical protein
MQFLQEHLDKQEQLCEAFRQVYGHAQLSEEECDELLAVLNQHLPGPVNRIVHHLRKALCLAIDVMRTEDALVAVKESVPEKQS